MLRVPSALSGRPQSCSAAIRRQVLQIENLCLHLRLLRPWNASIRQGHLHTREQHTRKNDGTSAHLLINSPSIDRSLSPTSGIDRSSFDELNFRFDELANSILLFFFSFTNIYLLIDREYFSRITTTTDVSFTFRVTCKSANNRRDYHIECKPRVKRSLVFHSSPITRVDWSRPWTRGIAKPAIFKKTGTRYWNAGRGRSAIG